MSLELKNVMKHYPEFTMELSFHVESGELVTLLGPSGCGKTTTLHLIAGFITPDSGSITIDGHDVIGVPPHLRRIGVVFQDYALFPNMNVFSNIAFGLRMHNWDKAAIKKRLKELLKLIRLPGYEWREVNKLSGGEQQRVALARALAPNPQLLLLDEPLSALDAKLRKELRSDIKRIQRELQVTTVYVTHDQEEALALSDRIVVMHNGRIEQTGKPWDIYNRPETGFVASFMGMSNRIEGVVANTGGSYVELDTPEGRFFAPFPKKLGVGCCIALLFRPEQCRLVQVNEGIQERNASRVFPGVQSGKEKTLWRSGPGGAVMRQPTVKHPEINTLTGTVTTCEYLGESTLIKIETEHGYYTALFPCSAPLLVSSKAIAPTTSREFEAHAEILSRMGEGMDEGGSLPSPTQRLPETPLRTGSRVSIKVAPENCWLLPSS